MGWEVWYQEDGENDRYLMGFFDNTLDQSFGPVLMVDYSFDKSNYYKMWDKANLADPRYMEVGELEESAKWVRRLIDDYTDIATANLKIYKVKPNSAPYLIHEDNIKASHDSLSFSPYNDTLENPDILNEDEYDRVHDMIEELNDEMKDHIAMRDDTTKSWMENMRYGLRGEITWKVLDE